MVLININKLLICGILFVAGCSLVFSNPAPQSDDDMQGDDYDYSIDDDDQNGSNQQSKPAHSQQTHPKPYFLKPEITVTGILGQNIVVKCDARNLKENVVLWYYGDTLISTGKDAISPKYFVDPVTFDLTIIDANEKSEGDYYCELIPEKIRMHAIVNVAEHSLATVFSESSTSAQDKLCFHLAMLVLTLGTGLLHLRVHL